MYKITDIELIEHNIPVCYIKESPIHGMGLFAIADIEKGTVLTTLDGQYLSDEIVKNLNIDLKFQELNYLPTQDMWLVRGFLTDYSAINHSSEPNVRVAYEPLRIIAQKDIKKDEEILMSYSKERFPDYFIKKYNINTEYL